MYYPQNNKIIYRIEKRNRFDIKPKVHNFKISDVLPFISVYEIVFFKLLSKKKSL